MINKEICRKCKYHGKLQTGARWQSDNLIICEYNVVTGEVPLKNDGNGGVIDIRGTDENKCELFEEGKRIYKRNHDVYADFTTPLMVKNDCD